jgi:hypothetical protein
MESKFLKGTQWSAASCLASFDAAGPLSVDPLSEDRVVSAFANQIASRGLQDIGALTGGQVCLVSQGSAVRAFSRRKARA